MDYLINFIVVVFLPLIMNNHQPIQLNTNNFVFSNSTIYNDNTSVYFSGEITNINNTDLCTPQVVLTLFNDETNTSEVFTGVTVYDKLIPNASSPIWINATVVNNYNRGVIDVIPINSCTASPVINLTEGLVVINTEDNLDIVMSGKITATVNSDINVFLWIINKHDGSVIAGVNENFGVLEVNTFKRFRMVKFIPLKLFNIPNDPLWFIHNYDYRFHIGK